MKRRLNSTGIIWALGIIAVLSIILCTGLGPVFVTPSKIAKIVLSRMPMLKEHISVNWTNTEYAIVIETRIPRVLLGFVVGCTLSLGGGTLQGLVHNHLADPYIMGASYGAAAFAVFGITIGLFSSLGVYQNAVNGCIGALVALLFIFAYSLHKRRINISHLLLGGIAISLFAKAVVQVISLTNLTAFLAGNSSFWTQGGLGGTRWEYLKVPLLVIIICFAIITINYRNLNAILCGEETAKTLGVSVKTMQKVLIVTTSVMIGITVAISGGIGFVGLVVPNITRMIVGSDNKRVFPISALIGGIAVIWCDVAARMLFAPTEVSVGIITAMIGGPFFLWVLKKHPY